MSATGSRRRGAETLPPTVAPLLGRRVAAWRSISPSTMRRLPRQRTEHVPLPRRRGDASAGGGGGAVAGRCSGTPLAVPGRALGRDFFYGFNGHDTHWSRVAVPMPGAMRPSCPRGPRERGAPHRAQGRAAPAATRADPRACSALRVRPRTPTSKAARACRPCTASVRMDLRRGATPRQGAAHPTPQPRRRPRGIAPCTAH